jgi:hypothetical protein
MGRGSINKRMFSILYKYLRIGKEERDSERERKREFIALVIYTSVSKHIVVVSCLSQSAAKGIKAILTRIFK